MDNALKGVLRGRRHSSGDIVRVGPPQLKEIADDPHVSLPLMVRARLADVEGRRAQASAELLGIRRRAEELAELEASLVRVDAEAYAQARALVTEPFGDAASRDVRVAELKKAAGEVGQTLAAADQDLNRALKDRDDAEDSRHLWNQVDALLDEADRVEDAATAAESAALLSQERLRQAQRTLREVENRTGLAKLRSRAERAEAQAACGDATGQYRDAQDHALKARDIADRRRAQIAVQTEEMMRAIPFSAGEIDRRDTEARLAATRYRTQTARTSLWLWTPWVARRVRMILPELRAAADRGVRVTVFVRDPSDQLQKKPANASLVEDLRAVVHTVVPMHVMHQKIVVVDEKTVMLGSLNALSQSWTREVMVTMRGAYFARKILTHEHAEVFARPPKCPHCGQDDIEIRRGAKENWYWRCYNRPCPTGGGNKAWKKDIDLWRRSRV
ncbi:phospholipase D-like domain-containing protein [Streptomyces yangpuensis]|uniref:phospholipase D-like domain-containing protein n=1 Tax=Streptomyces yangpuensis TaxID=1648182 RepID=UPI0036826CCE